MIENRKGPRVIIPSLFRTLVLLAACLMLPIPSAAQDIVSSQLRQGFGRNKVRYKAFDWHFVESEHLLLHYEPEFEDLADRAVEYLEDAYAHISGIMRHELSTKQIGRASCRERV